MFGDVVVIHNEHSPYSKEIQSSVSFAGYPLDRFKLEEIKYREIMIP